MHTLHPERFNVISRFCPICIGRYFPVMGEAPIPPGVRR